MKQLGSVRTNQAGSPRTPSDDKVASKDAMLTPLKQCGTINYFHNWLVVLGGGFS